MTSIYTIPTLVRRLLNLDEADASDTLLNYFIDMAANAIIAELTANVKDEEPTGLIDGTNKEFEVDYSYIADIDADKVRDKNDITVWGWEDADDPNSRVELEVDSISQYSGQIYLVAAPSKVTYKKITVDYSFYEENMDTNRWSLVEQAATEWTAYYYVFSQLGMGTPASIGKVRLGFNEPWARYYKMYRSTMDKLRVERVRLVKRTDIVQPPRELESEVDPDIG